MSLAEPIPPSDVLLGIDQFDLVRQVAFAKRICRMNKTAMQKLDYIEKHTTHLLDEPISSVEYKVRAVLGAGLIPIDVIGEINQARMDIYQLVMDNQKVGLFG